MTNDEKKMLLMLHGCGAYKLGGIPGMRGRIKQQREDGEPILRESQTGIEWQIVLANGLNQYTRDTWPDLTNLSTALVLAFIKNMP